MFRAYNPVIHYDLGAVPTRDGVIQVADTQLYEHLFARAVC